MTEEDRKFLIEWLGECWEHQWRENKNPLLKICSGCGEFAFIDDDWSFWDKHEYRRPCETPSDRIAIKSKMQEQELWEKFSNYCIAKVGLPKWNSFEERENWRENLVVFFQLSVEFLKKDSQCQKMTMILKK